MIVFYIIMSGLPHNVLAKQNVASQDNCKKNCFEEIPGICLTLSTKNDNLMLIG